MRHHPPSSGGRGVPSCRGPIITKRSGRGGRPGHADAAALRSGSGRWFDGEADHLLLMVRVHSAEIPEDAPLDHVGGDGDARLAALDIVRDSDCQVEHLDPAQRDAARGPEFPGGPGGPWLKAVMTG
jgi:hypothetical protein